MTLNDKTPSQQISDWLTAFAAALDADPARVVELFEDDGYWRDLVAFTWNLYTAEGKAQIHDLVQRAVMPAHPSHWAREGDAIEAGGGVEGAISFETPIGRGQGYLRLRRGKAWTLLTELSELKGFEERTLARRDPHLKLGPLPGRTSWREQRQAEAAELGVTKAPYVVIIGGAQAGLILGARLRVLGVPTLILEKNERPGDNWRKRYKNLVTHDVIWLNKFPYLDYPDSWPVHFPKDKFGDWLEIYAKAMDLNIWGSTECTHAAYDAASQQWTIDAVRGGQPVTLHASHLVIATGLSGMPNLPAVTGAEAYQGEIFHSSNFPGADAYRGKHAVVVGSGTSAHDICQGLWEDGAQVTMIQRSPTCVLRYETVREMFFNPAFVSAESGITMEKANLVYLSIPAKVLADMCRMAMQEVKRRDAAFYDELTRAGFLFDFGEDDTGFVMKYRRTASGYYFNLGGSELLIDGQVKLRTRVTVSRFKERSLILSDGTELPADVVVFATGFKSMDSWVAKLMGADVATKVGRVWGLGSGTAGDPGPWEGEERNICKPTRQEALWFQGGAISESRTLSKYLALQLKARMEQLPTPVYRG